MVEGGPQPSTLQPPLWAESHVGYESHTTTVQPGAGMGLPRWILEESIKLSPRNEVMTGQRRMVAFHRRVDFLQTIAKMQTCPQLDAFVARMPAGNSFFALGEDEAKRTRKVYTHGTGETGTMFALECDERSRCKEVRYVWQPYEREVPCCHHRSVNTILRQLTDASEVLCNHSMAFRHYFHRQDQQMMHFNSAALPIGHFATLPALRHLRWGALRAKQANELAAVFALGLGKHRLVNLTIYYRPKQQQRD